MEDFNFKRMEPHKSLTDFVESFWMLQSQPGSDKEVIILPDGRIDLTFSKAITEPFHITLSGLETRFNHAILAAGTRMFAISFKPLGVEYILQDKIADLIDYARHLPVDFWGFNAHDLDDFDNFCEKASEKIQLLLPRESDSRKQKLFDLIYATDGTITIKELSEKVFWSSRQINRYFNQQFGLSLKTYCNILRFRASFQHIKEGKLFPQHNFADQSHFIKEVKKLSGVSPKELKRNRNDRFIHFSTLHKN